MSTLLKQPLKLTFSGHDSFVCKHFWLKKGYDFVANKMSFGDESAVVQLGVGKNMVSAINFWLKSFGITDTNGNTTEIGKFLFDEKKGSDKFIENIGTVWLLHYFLIITERATLYNLFFNEFRRTRIEFNKDQLLAFIKRKYDDLQTSGYNENTISNDINVFVRNYLTPSSKEGKIDIEEDFAGLLIDLSLLSFIQKTKDEKNIFTDWFKVENEVRAELPHQIVLFSILDNDEYGKSISFRELLNGNDSPGAIFCLNEAGLYQKIEQITDKYKNIIYTETAGVKELQFKTKPDKWQILNDYYKA
jgi:hypothetical protein